MPSAHELVIECARVGRRLANHHGLARLARCGGGGFVAHIRFRYITHCGALGGSLGDGFPFATTGAQSSLGRLLAPFRAFSTRG